MAKKKKPSKVKHLHPLLAILLLSLLAIIIFLLIMGWQAKSFQSGLSNFYNIQDIPTQGQLGEIVRSEPLSTTITNGTASRIIYRTQRSDGSNTFSSGMIFIPSVPATEPRPIMAWAHGTIGMGDQCAPSRQKDPIVDTGIDWVDSMLLRGWVVVSTDYAGLGTPGTEAYLVGTAEANDVLNSVRAAKNFPGSDAGNNYAVWGHSQGGHSAIFTANRANSYLPEFNLVGTAATAPAAQLGSLFAQQENTAAAWVIGPEVVLSWPDNNPALSSDGILSKPGINNYKPIAEKCIKVAALEGIIRNKLGQKFFNDSFASNQSWQQMITQETAPVLRPNQPLFVGESLTDQVVLPNTTAQYIQRACSAGSNLTSEWLTDVGHIQLQQVIAPSVISWVADRFAGRPTSSTCNQALPIAPAQ